MKSSIENDKFLRLHTQLNSLKQNLPQTLNIHEKYVREYELILDNLQDLMESPLSEFRVPEEELKQTVSSVNNRTGQRTYTKDKFCSRNYFFFKLDALLGYLDIRCVSQPKSHDEKPRMGF